MATGTDTLSNPTPSAGEHQFGPSAWFIPNSGSSVSMTMTCYTSSNGNQTVSNLTLYLHNITGNADTYSNNFGSGIYSATASSLSSASYNGSNVFTPGFSATSACDHVTVTVTYTGRPYSQVYTYNGSSFNAQTPQVYNAGTFETYTNVYVYNGGTWEQIA